MFQSTTEEIRNIEIELERLTLVNNEYEKDYQREKQILLFNMYEKQYLLDTKTMYHTNQQELINNIKIECQNLESIVKMYKHRIESNSQHINSLNDGANVMKEHIIKITDDVQIVREKIDSLDTNRKVAIGRNYDLRNKYITLLFGFTMELYSSFPPTKQKPIHIIK